MAEISAPPRPSWCTELEGEVASDESRLSGTVKKGRERQNDVSPFLPCLELLLKGFAACTLC